jgi:alkaline phosphatase
MAALLDAPEGPVAGFFGEGAMPYEADGLGDLPRLPQMVELALARLSRDPDGFFLLVEGGLIDHACHANDIARCVPEVLAFDEAVRAAEAWMGGRGDTLLLVTADHETGGLAVTADNGPGALPDVAWSSGWHTASLVGAYAAGLNAECVAGLADNTQLRGAACAGALMPAAGVRVWRAGGGALWSAWSVGSGDVCRVEFSRSLRPPAWQPCGVLTAGGARVSFEVPAELASGASGFLRLITLP